MLNKLLYIALQLAGFLAAVASFGQTPQNKPNNQLQVSSASTVATPPIAYPTGTQVNYVRTKEAIEPITDEETFNSKPYTSVKEATQYIDGLGRPLQTVIKQGSAGTTPKDIVSPFVYDGYGRETFKYLPYVQTTGTNTIDGSFKIDPFNNQSSFYSNTTLNPGLQGEQVYYNKTEFEASPLNRVTKTLAPGNSWAGSNRGIGVEYRINDADDAVRIWNITNTALTYDATTKNIPYTLNVPTTPSDNGIYTAGQLYETVTTDEHGKKVVEYKDKEGKVILKKVQIDTDVTSKPAHDGWLCTYYVYDDLGQLRFVIPPKAVKKISVDWQLFEAVINELCFRYEYDARQRMIAKKVPGSAWVYMVYDKRDRLTYTQDANMRKSNQWLVTLYDVLNRPKVTGMIVYNGAVYNGITYSNNRDGLQLFIDNNFNAANSTTDVIAGLPHPADLLVDLRESGRSEYKATNLITFNPGFTSEYNAGFVAEIAPGSANENVAVQNNPLPPNNNFIALTITYYDDYSHTSRTYNTADNSKLDNGGNSFAENVPSARSTLTKGMVTGSKVRVLEDPTNLALGEWMESITFYDDKGRVIQVQSGNYKKGTESVTNLYDFTGKVLTTYTVHNNPAAGKTIRTKTNMLYDHGGRLLEVKKTVNDNTATTRLIAKNEYDEMGQLNKKNLGLRQGTSADYVEQLKYTYNIRGWLQGINKDYVSGTGGGWFGMELNYDWGFNNPQYNGNIAGTKWRSKGDGEKRANGFGYDAANRLLYGDFSQHDGSNYIDNNIINFDMMIGDGVNVNNAYDENGNIKQMQQWGLKLNSSPQIDNIYYRYNENSNKLKNVWDQFNDEQTRLGDFRTSVNHPDKTNSTDTRVDYTYDENGNLKKDLNKDIGDANVEGIEYNHLNLPWKITVKNKGTITYIYDAAGNKLEKRTEEPAQSKNTKTAYISGYIYENDKLQFFSHEEGRIREKTDANNNVTGYSFDYFIKDHLGNVRMVLTDEKDPAAVYQAGMEDANRVFEVALFGDKVNSTEDVKPLGFDAVAENKKVSKVNGSTAESRVGPGVILKVMSGDKFKASVNAWYKAGIDNSTNTTLNNIIDNLLSQLTTGVAAAAKGTVVAQVTSSTLQPGMQSFLNGQAPVAGAPKAYLNWLLLDEEQFKAVPGNNGFVAVPAITDASTQKQLLQANAGGEITVQKNGYLYVYVSNESQGDVFFDDIRIEHTRGALLEETHYYPFGLTMSGISSKAAGGLENKHKLFGKEIQNKEFADGSGLEWYDYGMREYDHQVGRFFRVDPLAEKFYYLTPYQFCSNNPISNVDLDGLEGIDFRWIMPLIQNTVQNPNGTSAKVLGTVAGVGGAVTNVVTGAAHAVRHPIQTLQGLGRMATQTPAQNAVDYGVNISSQYTNSGSNAFTNYAAGAHVLTDIAMALSPMKEGFAAREGNLAKNLFKDVVGVAKGDIGEALTKGVLEKQFKGAEIMEQVNIKMDGASMRADFVVVKDGKVMGVFESKVDGGKLSNGQSLFFKGGETGTLTGKNAGQFNGVTVDPSKLNTGVYKWDSKTGSFTVQ